MRNRFIGIFRQAKHENPEESMEQVVKLLPYAEKHSREGLPHRNAWAAASLEFPHLLLARDAVSLYLGCGHSTGNVERCLKLVALHEHIRSSDFVKDILYCTQAPQVTDVSFVSREPGGSRMITPKGTYLPRLLKAYGKTFGGRRWKGGPEARRDKGVARPTKDAAVVKTEAAFLR